MDTRYAERIEGAASFGAAAILAAAVAIAAVRFTASTIAAAAAAVAAFFVTLQILRSIGPGDSEFSLAPFAPVELATDDLDELLLTEADRLDRRESLADDDELLLDDVLASLEGDSRVVRLFDASAMPTPGQLKTRIDRHLGQTRPGTGSPDASAALHDALAELRQSLK